MKEPCPEGRGKPRRRQAGPERDYRKSAIQGRVVGLTFEIELTGLMKPWVTDDPRAVVTEGRARPGGTVADQSRIGQFLPTDP